MYFMREIDHSLKEVAVDTAFVPSGIELNYHNLLAHEAYGS